MSRRAAWAGCATAWSRAAVAIADFICPTPETREAFGEAFTVFVDRITAGRFEHTNRMFVRPDHFDVRVEPEGTPQYWAECIFRELRPAFDPKRPAALFIGRYQPFHGGYRRLIEEGLRWGGQVCIAVRDTQHTDAKNPLSFFDVSRRIEAALRPHPGRFVIAPLPNISHVFYGRGVGYVIERIVLDDATEATSATETRKKAGRV